MQIGYKLVCQKLLQKVDFGVRFSGFGHSLRFLVSVLWSDFFDPPMLRLLFVFAVVSLLSRMAMAECQVNAGESTIDLGKCDDGTVKIKFNGSDLKFNFQYGEKSTDKGKPISLEIGGCALQFDLVSLSDQKSCLLLAGTEFCFYFPVPVKVGSSGIVVGKGSVAKTVSCASFKPAQGNIVDFKIKLDDEISGLRIKLDDATVFDDVHEDSRWGVNGWRLWTTIICIILWFVLISSAGGVFWFCRKKTQAELDVAPPEKNEHSKQVVIEQRPKQVITS
ncbi:hypothetical protein M3Y95_00386400 [Aphelenchoides besseyi]|nr:hypothetical protein M3Y95_00386400 [Aphelenchoides besseyi]